MAINQVTVSGNLTRDSELRQTQNGTSVLTFCVAVNERRKNPQGEWEDYPNYIDCVTYGKRAEAVHQYFAKGAKVCVSGRLHWSQWETEGKRRSKVEVVADELEFMSRQEKPQQVSYYADEDIPF